MNKRSVKGLFRLSALFFAVLFCAAALTGCAARKLPTSDEDLTVVGTVGEYEVLYEELRFLVLSYKEELENRYGDGIWEKPETREKYLPELKERVYEDLEANYAVLTLAAKSGITADGYEAEVQDYMKTAINSDFGGDRSLYKEFLKAAGVTDHYVRFTATVDHVYEDLFYLYLDNGTIPDGETEVKQYILQNFVYVASIGIMNYTEADSEAVRARAEKYRREVMDGADVRDYIKYTLNLTPLHCFARGEMDPEYEAAAFALQNVGDVSEVFLSKAEANGETLTAWYFLQKLELTPAYVEENFQTLFDQYADAKMNEMLDAEKDALVFVPNDYCKGLDLLSIEPIEDVKDNTWVFVTVGVSVGAVLLVGLVLLFRLLNRKPKPENGQNR